LIHDSKSGAIVDLLVDNGLVFVSEVCPLAIVLQTLDVLRCQLHLSEFLREVLRAVLVVQLRPVRSWLLLLVNGIPVDAGEPRVGHDLLSICWTRAQSSLWVLVKQLRTDVLCILAQEAEINSRVAVFDVSKEFLLILAIERWFSTKHFIDYASERPPIGCLTMALI
jgi:hypothetical protein